MIPLADTLDPDRHYYLYEEVKIGSLTLLKSTGEKVTLPKEAPVPEKCSWWECPKANEGRAYYLDIETGLWHEGPDNISLEALHSALLQSAQRTFEADVKTIEKPYSKSEEATWNYQLSEATQVLAGGSSSFLEVLANATGEDVKSFAQKIKTKSDAYMTAQAQALAKLRKARYDIEKKSLDDILSGLNFQQFLALGL